MRADRTFAVPAHVEAALAGRYNRKVHVLDADEYHLWHGNVHEHVRVNGRVRTRVTGALMLCGAVESDGAWIYEWAHRAVPVEDAAAVAAPCLTCFPRGMDSDGR